MVWPGSQPVFLPDRIATSVADVAKTEQVKAFVDATVAKWGAIDVLFSNAGNDGPLIPTVDYPEDIFDQIIATHVRGCFLVCKYTLPKDEGRRQRRHHVKHHGREGRRWQLFLCRSQACAWSD